MSSNIRLQKVCEECRKEFIAKTMVTRFCCHQCNSRNYKRQQRNNLLDNAKNKGEKGGEQNVKLHPAIPSNLLPTNLLTTELLDIQELTVVIGLSERSIYRLLKDPMFPRMQIGKRVLFKKQEVLNYLTTKYSKNERTTSGDASDKRKESVIY